MLFAQAMVLSDFLSCNKQALALFIVKKVKHFTINFNWLAINVKLQQYLEDS